MNLVEQGMYEHHLQRWLQTFPLNQFHFVDSNKLVHQPWAVMEDVEQFLGLEPNVTREDFQFVEEKGFYCPRNRVTGEPECLSKGKGWPHPEMPGDLRAQLLAFYEPLNKRFFQLIGQDFNWSTPKK